MITDDGRDMKVLRGQDSLSFEFFLIKIIGGSKGR